MAEENNSTVNLDLNLSPTDNSSDDREPSSGYYSNVTMNLEDWLDGQVHRVREVVRQRNQRWRSLRRQVSIPPETRTLAMEFMSRNASQNGEGNVAPEERPTEVAKTCENCNYAENDNLGKKEHEKNDDGNFFDCNICLDLAKEPVVTCCGHLFCWSCIYRWLHHHSDAKECPVCKGEVSLKNVIPIYGRGNNKQDQDSDSSLKIPFRPAARQLESWRQTIERTAFTIPMEEMIRRLGSTFDLSQELSQIQSNNPHEASPDRGISLLNRILSYRAMRREFTPVVRSPDLFYLTEPNFEVRDTRRLSSLLLRQSNSHRAGLSNLINSADNLAAERLVESYFRSNPVERNQQHVPFDDRDSVSSIAAVIHSENQTVNNVIEIDSTVSRSTLSSRRRNDASRISDVDSGDSRALRRRRLN